MSDKDQCASLEINRDSEEGERTAGKTESGNKSGTFETEPPDSPVSSSEQDTGIASLVSKPPGDDNASYGTSQTNSNIPTFPESDLGRKEKKNWIQVVQEFYKSDFAVFMAYTALSAFAGGVFGAFLTVYVPRYIGLDNGTVAHPQTVIQTTAQTTCPTDTVSLQEKIDKMNENLGQCQSDQKTDKEMISRLKSEIGTLNTNVMTLDTHLSTMRQETQTNYTLLTQNVTLRNFVVESQMSELKQVFVSKEWLFIILLMGLFEVAVIGVVWVMWQKLTDSLRQKLRGRSGGHQVTERAVNGRAEGGRIQGERRLLDHVRPCRLENLVCVISFHSMTVDKHGEQVKAILSQNEALKQVTSVQFLICKHEDISQLPPAKLYMVFVDFNERNVILEDPNKGLGDLRLTTVQAIEKMGADAILTYSGDKGSSSLTSGHLYNQDLSSVRQHSELSRLDSRKRMLSVFNKFNKTQVDHIVKVVKDVVK